MHPSDPDYNANSPQATNPYYSNNTSHTAPPQEMFVRPPKVMVIWRIVATIYALVALGLAFYWEFTDSGMARMSCNWQADLLNSESCYIALNIAVPMLILLLPLLIVKILIEKITGVKLVNPKFKG
jgi:hypothetical protein